MNQLLALLLLTLSTLFLAACTPEADSEAATNAQTNTETVAKSDDDLESLSNEMTLPKVEFTSADDIGLLARIHFATHTPDFDRARAFYRNLGYTEGITGFPLTNTHEMARALGMFDVCQYELVKGEVMALPGSPNPASIDLLQFKTPFNDDPPYELPNHLGMAFAVFRSADFDNDLAILQRLDAQLLGPVYGSAGQRMVFFRDPDDVLYQLQESGNAAVNLAGSFIHDMSYININVSDLEASTAFYELFGYEVQERFEHVSENAEEAAAWGMTDTFRFKGVEVAIDRGDKHRLRLVQWLQPFNPEPSYPPPINHIGINRIALLVPDMQRAVNILKRHDVPFLSEPANCCSGTGEDASAIVHAIDPDGVFLELVGGYPPQPLKPPPEGCPPLEIKLPPPAS